MIPSGVHTFTTTLQSALTWGENVAVIGQDRDTTILQAQAPFAGAAQQNSSVVNINSSVKLSNLTIDGAYVVQNALTAFGPGSVHLENCRLMRGNRITSVFGRFVPTFLVRNCIYTGASNGADQQAIASINGGLFEGNLLDRRDGQGAGSSLTFGNGTNITVRNNTMIRPASMSQGAAISLEPHAEPGYDNFEITGNNITNGHVKIGGGFTQLSFQLPMRNIRVVNNTFNNAQIWILGPRAGSLDLAGQPIPVGLGVNMITNLTLQPNTFNNPPAKPPIARDGMLSV
jgi:hypothetical protein